MTKGNETELELTRMVATGEALGRQGKRLFYVPFGATGDQVRVRVVDESKRGAHAEIVEILSPSPYRIKAPCSHFGVCGGCQWQHIDYPAQLALKRTLVLEHLRRQSKQSSPTVEAVIGMSDPWGYHTQAEFFVSEDGEKGFPDLEHTHIVPLRECLVVEPTLWELLDGIDLAEANIYSISLRAGLNTDDMLIIFETTDDSTPELELSLPVSCILRRSDGSVFSMIGNTFYYEMVKGLPLRVSANSFFHANTAALEVLVSLVEEYLAPSGHETLADLFCGVGTFGLSLANQVGQVIGIDSDIGTIEDAQMNASDCDNVHFIAGPVEKLPDSLQSPVHLAIVDPPQDGCSAETMKTIGRIRPRRLVHFAQNLSALARDTQRLDQAGYRLQKAQPIDMTPQSNQVQTLSLWKLTSR